jgi:hypothetical protein
MLRTATFTLLVQASLVIGQSWHLRPGAEIPDGRNNLGAPVCADVDRDSQPDLTFWRSTPDDYRWLWQVYEYRSYGQFELVQSETCVGHTQPDTGTHKGMFIPTDVGDIDGDGLTEYLGYNEHYSPGSVKSMVCLYEVRDTGPENYPDTLVWRYEYSLETDAPYEWYVGDMDRDGLPEVLATNTGYTYVFELRGNNRLDSVFRTPLEYAGFDYAIGDFDRDSATEFVFAAPDLEYAYVYECVGNDQYALSDSLLQPYGRNGYDAFAGNDVDGDGKPEFFIKYDQFTGSISNYRLLMYEAIGNNEYEATEVDSQFGVTGWPSDAGASCCADIDGDGTEEVVVSYDYFVCVLKATGNHQFARTWLWRNPGPGDPQSQVSCYDMNRNGYQDIVISGNGHTWMYEMEGIRLLEPNGGDSLVPGETCQIRWRLYTPPRCDSVSLFLRRDDPSLRDPKGRSSLPAPEDCHGRGRPGTASGAARNDLSFLDTIATGIAPSESSYDWVVPPGPVDSARIVAVAYGPGELFDESDTPISILPGGCEESQGSAVRNWAMWVWPNPVTSRARVRFDVPHATSVSVTVLDACGRVVRTLASGQLGPGSYERRLDAGTSLPAGIYVVSLAADGRRMSAKVVLTE